MRHVGLINPKVSANRLGHNPAESAREPLGILSIGSLLKHHGYGVEILDANLYPEVEFKVKVKQLVATDPIYLGLSVMTSQIPHALELTEYAKRLNPALIVIWGGIHPTLFPAQTSLDPRIDLVVHGSGESTALELARKLENGRKDFEGTKGIAYQGKVMPSREPENLDSLPFLDYRLLDLKWYLGPAPHYLLSKQPLRALTILSSRGCPWRCGFCVNYVTKNRWRAQSSERFLDELVRAFDLEAVRMMDEDFFVNPKRATAIVEGMRTRGIHVSWGTNVRANYFSDRYINEDYARRLAEAGVKFLSLGAESGSDQVLQLLCKDITVDQIIRSARVCASASITPVYSWMIGIPEQTKSAMRTNLDLMNSLNTICPSAVQYTNWIFRPFPGGTLYEKCKQMGLREPSSLEEWARLGVDREWNTGFLPASELTWIDDVDFVKFLATFTPLLKIPSKSDAPASFPRRVLAEIVRFLYNSWDLPFVGWLARQAGNLLRRFVLMRRSA